MKSWKVFKSAVPMYLCDSDKSSFMSKKNILIAKSGVNNYACNFALIENLDAEDQKEVISKNFKCDGLIFALQECKTSIDSWSESLGFKYIGRFPLMNKKQEQTDLSIKYYDNIRVERVVDTNTLKEFIKIFSETRKISVDRGARMFSENFLNPMYFIYIGYYLDKPAGIFVAINTKDGVFVTDADVKEEFRQSNILKVLSERAVLDAVANELYDYSVVPTSQFAYNVIMQHGFYAEYYCDIWQRGDIVNV
jgi:hypothetical protein